MLSKKIRQQIVSIVYPPQCCLCLRQQESRMPLSDICGECELEVTGDLINRCSKCGATVKHFDTVVSGCPLCRKYRFRFERASAIGNYQGLLKTQVLRMKRDRNEIVAFQFGRLLGNQLEKFGIDSIDVMTPIPIAPWKRLKRGFHAADVIADGIRQVGSIRKSNRLLYCKRATEKQGKLSTPQRFKNMRGAFATGRTNIKSLTVLIVDDVMTSGATVDQATKVLLKAGAASVFVAVVARGARVS